jgi:hypothetical protein
MNTPSSIEQFRAFAELKDFRPATKKDYVRYLRKLSEHYECDPASLTEDQLRRYCLFLRHDKQLSGSAISELKKRAIKTTDGTDQHR